MIKTKYLVFAAVALLLVVIAAGAALLSLPFIFDSSVQPVPDFTETEPAVIFPTSTPVVIIITEEPKPTEVVTDIPTEVPTETALPTATLIPTPTAIPIPCDWASFVMDVTVKDGMDMVPGEDFVKTWRVKNIGSCTWTTDYDLVFASGDTMNAYTTNALSGLVRPGESIDISIAMEAPEDEGAYTGYWLFRNPNGQLFGIGGSSDMPVWVSIDVSVPCLWAKFVKDVTVPDGTSFSPGVAFTKTWRLKNIGSCAWASSFDVVFVNGDKMGATIADLPQRVRPGETVDVSVALTAPSDPDDYRGYWKIEADNGTLFGIGDDQDNPFWVDIDVVDANADFGFDFAANYCSAVWRSTVGILPCPGTSGDSNGFVIRLNNPDLENRLENEPAIWTRPNRAETGWITGKFPAVLISDGDHFKAWIGCLDGSEECDVKFYLDYQINGGSITNLGTWHEIYDGDVTVIDIDLSSLAGENVSFSLTVEVNGGEASDADAFWFVPRIE